MRRKQKYLRISIVLLTALLLLGCDAKIIQKEEPITRSRPEEQILQTVPALQETAPISVEETVSAPTESLAEPPVQKDPWYNAGPLIYHACGGIDGISYSNSQEAMESTLAAGNMLVEVDFLYTTDGHLVCLHKWIDLLPMWKYKELKREYKDKEDQIPETEYTLEQFLKKNVKGKFTGQTARDIISYMQEYPELHIIVDTKEEDLAAVIGELLKLCDFQPDIAERFVIQLYDRGQKAKILELYPFRNENFLFTCYKFDPLRVDEILEICSAEQISVVTVPYGSWEQETVDRFLQQQIILFEHTVNDPEMAALSLEKGICGFYTDFLQKSELKELIY